MDPVLAALGAASKDGLMPPGGAILLAVSGGADSLALLHGAAELAVELRWTLSVAHVHHGWRAREADRDLAFVSDHARRLGIPFHFRRVDAAAASRRLRLSPEAGARHVRYAALFELAAEAASSRIATAHQAGDALESHVIARERGLGPAALAGPRRQRRDGIVRPLLSVTRREILSFLEERGLTHRRDRSNGRLDLPRNRIRHRLGRLEDGGHRRELDALGAALEESVRERDRIESALESALESRLSCAPDAAVADAVWLEGCAPDLQRRALEHACAPFALPGKPPLTGREREGLLRKLESGADFRFEAGRRLRFARPGPLLRVRPVANPSGGV